MCPKQLGPLLVQILHRAVSHRSPFGRQQQLLHLAYNLFRRLAGVASELRLLAVRNQDADMLEPVLNQTVLQTLLTFQKPEF